MAPAATRDRARHRPGSDRGGRAGRRDHRRTPGSTGPRPTRSSTRVVGDRTPRGESLRPALGAADRRARGDRGVRIGRRAGTAGETAVPSGAATPTELPHWTEPPTGQVPAVLARDSGDETAGPAVVAPTWREEDSDWVAHDEEFEPAMFGDDEVALGSLDETDDTDADRRPWEFDLDSPNPTGRCGRWRPRAPSPGADEWCGVADDPITEPTEAVAPAPRSGCAAASVSSSWPSRRRRGTRADHRGPGRGSSRRRAATPERAAPAPPLDDEADELFADKPLPTGSARLGRARRAGLLPGPDAGQAARRRRFLGRAALGRRTTRGVGHRRSRCRPEAGGCRRAGRRRPHRGAGRGGPGPNRPGLRR